MSGKIIRMIDTIIEKRSNGNATLMNTTRTKLILKGINPDRFSATSPDDPELIAKLQTMAAEMGVQL